MKVRDAVITQSAELLRNTSSAADYSTNPPGVCLTVFLIYTP